MPRSKQVENYSMPIRLVRVYISNSISRTHVSSKRVLFVTLTCQPSLFETDTKPEIISPYFHRTIKFSSIASVNCSMSISMKSSHSSTPTVFTWILVFNILTCLPFVVEDALKKTPFPCPCSYRTALTHYLDITGLPSVQLLKDLTQYATDAGERAHLTLMSSFALEGKVRQIRHCSCDEEHK